MFWKKKSEANNLPKPTGIPEVVGRYLIVELKRDPDWVWSLKSVLRPHPENKHLFDVHVFEEAIVNQRGAKIINYDSFQDHPGLMLYEGWFNKSTYQVQVTALTGKPTDSK